MAELTLSYAPASKILYWNIYGLSTAFVSSSFKRAGIALYPVTSGQSEEPADIIGYEIAGSSGYTEVSGAVSMEDYSEGAYTIYGWTQGAAGYYYPVDPVDIYIVNHWSWEESNGTATAEQTQLAYEAVTGKGKIEDFSYKVWNDLCTKVRTAIYAAGSSWWTNMGVDAAQTPTYTNAKMSTSDKTLTADRFNAVRGNVGGRISTGISPVSPGEKVYGSYFIDITNALNRWIDNIVSEG